MHAATAGLDDVDPARVRQELTAAGQTLLAYVPGRFGTVLLCATADRTSMHVIGPARPLRDAADRLRAAGEAAIEAVSGAVADRAFAAFTDRAAAVAPRVLPAEVRAHLASSRRLTIVGAGMLQSLPFDVLPLRIDDRDVPLGELLAVDYVANVASAAECAPRRPLRQPPVLAAALRTARHGSVRAMPSDIGRLVAPYDPKAVVHVDAAVAVPELLNALEQASIVHCIGHGDFDGNRIFEHAIRFTDHDDGLLRE
ncbi:MAG: CHAT domain-containing protein [Planctomycetes bacterium]|nr:CHAT domain-containing protein [Planctomycetota bacterium]